jgi:hypothetical protein
MTDDQLMKAAEAAGYSMIPPQDSSETEPETVTVQETGVVADYASASYQKLRSWLPASPSLAAWLPRAPA